VVRSFSTHGHLAAVQGSSTTVSRSDIRLIQHLDSSAHGLVPRWRLIGCFLILYYPDAHSAPHRTASHLVHALSAPWVGCCHTGSLVQAGGRAAYVAALTEVLALAAGVPTSAVSVVLLTRGVLQGLAAQVSALPLKITPARREPKKRAPPPHIVQQEVLQHTVY
jgi:hypothetical protein